MAKWVSVRRVQGMLRAQAFKSFLESQGVPVLLRYESAGPAIGITLDGLGEVFLLVPARMEQRARRLLLPPRPALLSRRRWWRAVRALRPLPARSRGSLAPATAGRSR